VSHLPAEIQAEANTLFHDTRLADIDPEAHAAFVIERVLERGTMRSVRALVHSYGQDRLRQFLRDGGASRISPRTLRLWQLYLKLSDAECTPRSSPRIKSPFWPH
jgi:hypothetical protein